MTIRKCAAALCLFGAVLLATSAMADSVNLVPYASVGPNTVDFEDVAGAPFPGVVYNGILTSDGVQFGKYFAGQTLSTNGPPSDPNDTLSNTASNPLTLQVGGANNNLSVGTDYGTNNLVGCGPLGCMDPNGYGEGSIAMVFPHLISQFGIETYFGDGGTAVVQFFRQDGSLIEAVTVGTPGTNFFGFSRDGGIADIAGIAVWTTDPGGLEYDNLRFDGGNSTVPEPGSIALFGSGILGLSAVLRRKLKL